MNRKAVIHLFDIELRQYSGCHDSKIFINRKRIKFVRTGSRRSWHFLGKLSFQGLFSLNTSPSSLQDSGHPTPKHECAKRRGRARRWGQGVKWDWAFFWCVVWFKWTIIQVSKQPVGHIGPAPQCMSVISEILQHPADKRKKGGNGQKSTS